ncbi:MAG: Zn-dependent hydrolase [Methanobacteriota archaeon]|nr:MAG: Zn-dependent hydrolase [Euryarchaeota archaeon]
MIIRWHGHACFELQSGFTLVVDPHDGRSLGLSPPTASADLVLVSHDHFDHNQSRNGVINTAGRHQFQGCEIKGIPAFHDEEQGAKRGEVVLFRFAMGGIDFLHGADLGHYPEEQLDAMRGCDLLFLPVGGVFTIDAEMAWRVAQAVAPRVVVPMHYRYGSLTLAIDEVQPFLDASPWPVVDLGSEMELEQEDLPTQPEVWRFLS